MLRFHYRPKLEEPIWIWCGEKGSQIFVVYMQDGYLGVLTINLN
jgi:hypothetical protein